MLPINIFPCKTVFHFNTKLMNIVVEIGTSLRLASEASDSLRNRQSEVRLMLR